MYDLTDIKPIIEPLINLLRSRKFMVAIMTLLVDLIIAYLPQLEAVRIELLTVFTLVGSIVIGAIAYEDGKEKGA